MNFFVTRHRGEFFMKSTLLLATLGVFFICSQVNAEVWKSSNDWNSHWENEYQLWINKKVHREIFKTPGQLLYGIRTDCADALYAIRIQFAYENSLPFIINAPDILKPQMKIFGNETNMFDAISDEKNRVRAFINFVSDEAGVDNLLKDTFPVAIKRINAGTLYLVEWQLLGMGKMNKHSYFIKGFNSDRDLIFYYSDAPRKLRTLEENVARPRFSYGYAPYGFRNWKQPQHLLIPEKEIPAVEGYSRDQYELLSKVGKKQILQEISRILKN